MQAAQIGVRTGSDWLTVRPESYRVLSSHTRSDHTKPDPNMPCELKCGNVGADLISLS